jgi:hypothetical protein
MRILVTALLAAIPVIVSAQAAPDTAKPDKPAKKVMASTTNVTPAAAPVTSPVAAEEPAAAAPGVASASLEKVNEAAGVVDNAQASAAQATEDATAKAGDKAKNAVEKKLKKLDKLFGK